MKTILGLDLGSNSVGWAVVRESESEAECSLIERLGVRPVPLTPDEQTNFEKGKSITTDADRTLQRGMRRNLQRFKLRRKELVGILKRAHFISDDSILSEQGAFSTFETYRLRAKAAVEEVSLQEFARILLMLNKKRGYRSNRKAQVAEEGVAIDGMDAVLRMYHSGYTPAQLYMELWEEGAKSFPDFYPSDLQAEFDRIWTVQHAFYPQLLTEELKSRLYLKNKTQTWRLCADYFRERGSELVGIKRAGKQKEQKVENYRWRVEGLSKQLGLEELAIVLQEINNAIAGASGLLGKMSDRSKELVMSKQTVGQYLMDRLSKDPNQSLKNLSFYRKDYLDEFERLWTTQARFHTELTDQLKAEIRDVVIFYQRRLKSKKALLSYCELESKSIDVSVNGKKKTVVSGSRVCPKSSLLFQEFKIWHRLNDVQLQTLEKEQVRPLTQEEKEQVFRELTWVKKLGGQSVCQMLLGKTNAKGWKLNFDELEGNSTMSTLAEAYLAILEQGGVEVSQVALKKGVDRVALIRDYFLKHGIETGLLEYDPSLGDAQLSMQLWHLLYSYEGDSSASGNEGLVRKLQEKFGFDEAAAKRLSQVVFKDDYASISSKAMRRILPAMKRGMQYSDACREAGYNHSKNSITKEENANRVLKSCLEILPKGSLRNPVVEKILNQMIHIVNDLMKEYGAFDEIRIELARDLKRSAEERKKETEAIAKGKSENERIEKLLRQPPFSLSYVGRNDIVRYKLYEELSGVGYKSLYSNTYISKEDLFSDKVTIEHIIPQASFYDDSFSNKTLEFRDVNIRKGNRTALDFVRSEYNVAEYKARVESLYSQGSISGTKRRKLLTGEGGESIPEGFLERDLRNTQYIAKKAMALLHEVTRKVTPTVGSITSKLREDWGLIHVMQDLNYDKYQELGLTEEILTRDGKRVKRITDWTKRNDHRHHAMDALTVAFTKPAFVQYFNNENANGIKEKYFDGQRAKAPMPIHVLRRQAIERLEEILVSIKAKNKVMTPHMNKIKVKGTFKKQMTLTPRGQLHKETVYGLIQRYETREEKINASFTRDKIETVCAKKFKEALLRRLEENGGDSKKAFTGKNSLEKNPLYTDSRCGEKVPEKVKTVQLVPYYTVRKPIDKDLTISKVVDGRLRRLLEERVERMGAKDAFSNLEQDPIMLDGRIVKRVTIMENLNFPEPLHTKKDQNGKEILNAKGQPIYCDYVQLRNNHHAAIFEDEKGEIQEHLVSFFEAVERARQGLPILDKNYRQEEGWKFLFSMKVNEYFVFPSEGYVDKSTGEIVPEFNPYEIDLKDPRNQILISPHLFRVQTISSKDYRFRHHLETSVANSDSRLKGITWDRIQSLDKLRKLRKVRVDRLGCIVAVDEYE